MNMKTHQPTPEQQKFMEDLKAQIPPDMPAQQILAVVSQFVGQLIALQDRRTMTADAAMQVVHSNIQIGNHAALLSLGDVEGHG